MRHECKSKSRQPDVPVAGHVEVDFNKALHLSKDRLAGIAYDSLVEDLARALKDFDKELLEWSWNELNTPAIPDVDMHLNYDGERMLSIIFFQGVRDEQVDMGWRVVRREPLSELV